jgi:Icc-related predicted phosphoesterase
MVKSIMKNATPLRVVCISDTHGFHHHLNLPPGDILIHAGDLLPDENQAEALADLNDWLGTLPYKHRVVIAGNHDLLFASNPAQARKLLTNAVYLENSGVELLGLKFWGCPVTPVIKEMAFAVDRGAASRTYWDEVPAGTDVLITHGPPFHVLDTNGPVSSHLGCSEITRAVLRVKPRLHVFGHVHGGYGREDGPHGISFVNCAILERIGEDQLGLRQPIILDLDSRPGSK